MNEVDRIKQFKKISGDGVRCNPTKMSIRSLYKMYKRRELELQPFFQRNYIVQNNAKFKVNLFRSIFDGWAIGVVHLQELKDEEKEFRLIDGQQRLRTIFDFLDGKIGISIKSFAKALAVPESSIREIFLKDEYQKPSVRKITVENISKEFLELVLNYYIDVCIYSADISDQQAAELFVRLNSLNP